MRFNYSAVNQTALYRRRNTTYDAGVKKKEIQMESDGKGI